MDNFKLYSERTSDITKQLLENKYVYSTIMLFLVMYGSLAAPKLPDFISRWFENPIIRLGLLFLIAYVSTKDYSVALVIALGISITFQTRIVHKLNKALENILNTSRLPKQAQLMEQPLEQPTEQPMEQVIEEGMKQEQEQENMTNPMPSDMSKLSTAVGDTMGLSNDRDDMDYLTNYGYDGKCPGKFDADIINPNNQYLYESVYSGNTV